MTHTAAPLSDQEIITIFQEEGAGILQLTERREKSGHIFTLWELQRHNPFQKSVPIELRQTEGMAKDSLMYTTQHESDQSMHTLWWSRGDYLTEVIITGECKTGQEKIGILLNDSWPGTHGVIESLSEDDYRRVARRLAQPVWHYLPFVYGEDHDEKKSRRAPEADHC